MSYYFTVSLLILLKTNSNIEFLDVFVTVLRVVFQRNLLLYSESFVQSKNYKEPEDLLAMWLFSSCSINFTPQNAVLQCFLNLTQGLKL